MRSLATDSSARLSRVSVDLSAKAMEAVTLEMKRSMKISATAISTASKMGATVSSLVPGAVVGRRKSASKSDRDSIDGRRGILYSAGVRKDSFAAGSESTNDHVTAVKWAKGGVEKETTGDHVTAVMCAKGGVEKGGEGTEKGRRRKGKWWSFMVRYSLWSSLCVLFLCGTHHGFVPLLRCTVSASECDVVTYRVALIVSC